VVRAAASSLAPVSTALKAAVNNSVYSRWAGLILIVSILPIPVIIFSHFPIFHSHLVQHLIPIPIFPTSLFPFPPFPFPLPAITVFRILQSGEMYYSHALKVNITKLQQQHYLSSFIIIAIYHYLSFVTQLSVNSVHF